jgi:Domain of unknown function (DUF4388)
MSREELVRIDETGALHPVGKVASQRMRARKGAFRLMPAPEHVIFLRYVGEDGSRDEHDGPVVRLAGEVTAHGSLCDIVALIAQAGWKGELVVVSGDASRSIFFESGNVVGGRTNVEAERLGALFYRLGVLTEAEVEVVRASLATGRKFGELAVELRLVSREKLFEVMVTKTKEIFFATLLVSDGMFYFLDRYDPKKVALRHRVNAGNLLMEGVQRMDESKYFRERIPSDSHIPIPIAGRSDPEEELRAVWQACDGKRSVSEIGRATGLAEFEVTRALFRLVQSGFLHIGAPKPEGAQALVSIFNDAITAIFEAVERGGTAGVLRDNLAGYATSIGIYDTLFAGAGPAPDGRLNEARIAQNIQTMGGAEADRLLSQWLHEYVSFALFDASSQLPGGAAQALSSYVSERIEALAPKS